MTKKEFDKKEGQLLNHKKLDIKFGTELIINFDEVDTTVNSTFIGMEMDNFLIISPPIPFNVVKNKLEIGAMLVVKFFNEGVIYAFQSKVKAMVTKPFKLLILEYPSIIQDFSLRQQKRILCYIPIITKINGTNTNGMLKNLSLGGAFCVFKLSSGTGLKVSDKFTMLCQFPGILERQPLEGIVKSLKRREDNLFIGVEFEQSKISKNVMDSIKHYISVAENFDENVKK